MATGMTLFKKSTRKTEVEKKRGYGGGVLMTSWQWAQRVQTFMSQEHPPHRRLSTTTWTRWLSICHQSALPPFLVLDQWAYEQRNHDSRDGGNA
jgi:hypothetical protein